MMTQHKAVMNNVKFRILEKDNTLSVIGGDADGLKLGVEIFSCYLNQHGRW